MALGFLAPLIGPAISGLAGLFAGNKSKSFAKPIDKAEGRIREDLSGAQTRLEELFAGDIATGGIARNELLSALQAPIGESASFRRKQQRGTKDISRSLNKAGLLGSSVQGQALSDFNLGLLGQEEARRDALLQSALNIGSQGTRGLASGTSLLTTAGIPTTASAGSARTNLATGAFSSAANTAAGIFGQFAGQFGGNQALRRPGGFSPSGSFDTSGSISSGILA